MRHSPTNDSLCLFWIGFYCFLRLFGFFSFGLSLCSVSVRSLDSYRPPLRPFIRAIYEMTKRKIAEDKHQSKWFNSIKCMWQETLLDVRTIGDRTNCVSVSVNFLAMISQSEFVWVSYNISVCLYERDYDLFWLGIALSVDKNRIPALKKQSGKMPSIIWTKYLWKSISISNIFSFIPYIGRVTKMPTGFSDLKAPVVHRYSIDETSQTNTQSFLIISNRCKMSTNPIQSGNNNNSKWKKNCFI